MKGDSESDEPALVQYRECVQLQNEVDKTLVSLCLWSATPIFAKKRNDVEHEREDTEPVTVIE